MVTDKFCPISGLLTYSEVLIKHEVLTTFRYLGINVQNQINMEVLKMAWSWDFFIFVNCIKNSIGGRFFRNY